MLEKDIKCWVCKRTEEEIIKETGVESRLINEIRDATDKREITTKNRIIRLRDVGAYGFSFPICAICEGLIYSIADEAAQDRIEFEIDEKRLLNRKDLRNVKITF